jgi:hypothetical protein
MIPATAGPSCRVSDNQDRSQRTFQFGDPNGVPPEEVFNLRRFIIAVFEPYNFGRRAVLFSDVEEVGISGYDDKPVDPRIFPNRIVRSEPSEAGFENVDRIGEKFGEAANQFRREIRVKQKPQRDRRSRPVCEA